jgi:hypothetical protein
MSKTPSPQKKVLLTHFDWNLQRLDEVLSQGNTDYFKGAALQRFGHTYTMAIKTIRGFDECNTEPCQNDEHCIALATKKGWAEESSQWQGMIADFKQINQKPNDHEVEVIYQKLPLYQKAFKSLYLNLQNLI